MKRTTIMLPAKLKLQAEGEARRQGVSLGKLIRLALEDKVGSKKPKKRFFPGFDFTFIDDGPADLSSNLDKYLNEIDDEDYQRQQADIRARKQPKRRRTA